MTSKELLENFKFRDFSKIDSIKTYDFSTLYTAIPHNKLKAKALSDYRCN
jgi:hypothetical protein